MDLSFGFFSVISVVNCVVYLGFDPVFVSAAGLSLSSTTRTPRVAVAAARASQPRSLIDQQARHADCFGFQPHRCSTVNLLAFARSCSRPIAQNQLLFACECHTRVESTFSKLE